MPVIEEIVADDEEFLETAQGLHPSPRGQSDTWSE